MADSDVILKLREEYMRCQDAGDAEGCSSFWDADGVIMPPNEPAVRGRDALRSWYVGVFQHVQLEYQLKYDDIQLNEGWSFANGTFTGKVKPRDGSDPIEDSGKFLEVHKQLPDGTWKFFRHMWSSDLSQD